MFWCTFIHITATKSNHLNVYMEWNRCKDAFHFHSFQVVFAAKLLFCMCNYQKAEKMASQSSSYYHYYDWIIAVWG